jgi:hypothetical protein
MELKEIINLIKEYPYEKNGVLLTIDFLQLMEKELVKLYQKGVR